MCGPWAIGAWHRRLQVALSYLPLLGAGSQKFYSCFPVINRFIKLKLKYYKHHTFKCTIKA